MEFPAPRGFGRLRCRRLSWKNSVAQPVDRSAAQIGGFLLQFAFDAKTGKLTPLDPPAVKPEPNRRHQRHAEAHGLGAVSAA